MLKINMHVFQDIDAEKKIFVNLHNTTVTYTKVHNEFFRGDHVLEGEKGKFSLVNPRHGRFNLNSKLIFPNYTYQSAIYFPDDFVGIRHNKFKGEAGFLFINKFIDDWFFKIWLNNTGNNISEDKRYEDKLRKWLLKDLGFPKQLLVD